jgi:membrane protease YdiL (CAAX protease family)
MLSFTPSETAPDLRAPEAPPRPPTLDPERPKWMHLAAVVLGVGPLYVLVFVSGLETLKTGQTGITLPLLVENIAVMLAFGLFLIALLLILGERPEQLQLHPGTLRSDISAGIALTFAIFGSLILLRIAMVLLEQLHLIPLQESVPDATFDLAKSVAQNRYMKILFFGPVIWGQAAIIEELTRVFVLTRLWKVWPAPRAKVVSVYAWSLVFGLAHIYEGFMGVALTALIGLVLGRFYLSRGRLVPMILAHGLYDTVVALILMYFVRHPDLLPAALL